MTHWNQRFNFCIACIFRRQNKLSMTKITVLNTEITVVSFEECDYISLTDMVGQKAQAWMHIGEAEEQTANFIIEKGEK